MILEANLTLRNNNSLSISGNMQNQGQLSLASSGLLTDVRVSTDTTLAGSAAVRIGNNTNNRIYGLTGNERLTIGSGQTVSGAGQLGVNLLKITNHGILIADQTTALFINPTGNDPLTNRGTLRVEAGSSMTVSGSNIVQDDVTAGTMVYGTLTVKVLNLQSGLVGGTGRIIGNLENSGGTVSPGASPGALIIQGHYSQGENGTLALEIDGPLQGVQHDWLSITGDASLNGALTVAFGYTPTIGSSYVVLTTGGLRTGEFVSVAGPSGCDIEVLYGTNHVTLTVAAAPEPGTYAMMLAGRTLMGWATAWRRRHAQP